MTVVLDASAVLGWCFEDESTTEIDDYMARVTETGAVVPALWWFEFANGLLMAERRGRISPDDRVLTLEEVQALPIRTDTQLASRSWPAIFHLAQQHKLTVYDAAYLELAKREGVRLVSLDRVLCRAALAEDVTVG